MTAPDGELFEPWPDLTHGPEMHLPVWVCGECGKGHLSERGVQDHQAEVDADGEKHDGTSYRVERVFLGTTLSWRADLYVGLQFEVAAFGRDAEGAWVGLVSEGTPSSPRRENLWWTPARSFVEACYPEDLGVVN